MSEELTAEQQASLDELAALIKPNTVEEGKILLVYSHTGGGKTSTFCQFPSNAVLVECKDESAGALKATGAIREDYPVITTTGYFHAIEVIQLLIKTKQYKHITIDGASGLHDWSDDISRNDDFDGSREKFTAYGAGATASAFIWDQFVDVLREARAAGLWCYVLAHIETSNQKNAQGADYIKNNPAISKHKRAKLVRYADAVLFIDFKTEVININKQSNVGKAVGGESRAMYCGWNASYEAKNRLGLPDEILLGDSPQEAYRALGAALKAGKKKTGENQ